MVCEGLVKSLEMRVWECFIDSFRSWICDVSTLSRAVSCWYSKARRAEKRGRSTTFKYSNRSYSPAYADVKKMDVIAR